MNITFKKLTWINKSRLAYRSVIKRPTASTTCTKSCYTDTTSGQVGITSGQASTTNGQTNRQTSTTSGEMSISTR